MPRLGPKDVLTQARHDSLQPAMDERGPRGWVTNRVPSRLGLAGLGARLSAFRLALGLLVWLWSSLALAGFGIPSLRQPRTGTPVHLLPVAHADARLDVGEGVVRAE